MIDYKRKDNGNRIRLNQDSSVPYFYFPILEQSGLVKHGFSTRLGGVSSGEFATMNFNMTRGDDPANVEENFRRFCKAIGCSWDRAIMTHQTHTVNLKVITEDMLTPGRTMEEKKPFKDIDGFVTNVPGAVLITSFADCVPLFFLDPVKKAIGLSHSGWRGTVNRMGAVTVNKMTEAFGSRPEDIIACIGPSICQDCYEVGEEVADEFRSSFRAEQENLLLRRNNAGRYQLDLWKANELILKEAGIAEEHLPITNVCTCCNPKLLFSHRFTHGKRGNLCAFLSLNSRES